MVLWTVCCAWTILAVGCGTPHGSDVRPASAGGRATTFKTALRGKFLTAENGGGGVVNANRDVASTWETFQLQDRNGGDLVNGDLVNLQALDGQFVCAENGGGGAVNANRPVASTWETFRVVKITAGDGIVRDGDQVALQTLVSGNFVSALDGGGGGIIANRTSVSGWETFVIGLAPAPGGGGGGACTPDQLSHCNCPNGFHCCPTDGSCFQAASDVIFTQCKNDPASTCTMGGGGGPPPPPPPPPPPGPGPGSRLRITSHCGQPIWIAHSDNVPDAQNIQLGNGQSHDFNIPNGGLAATRFWPKTGCDGSGHSCAIGDNGQGGGQPCPANGCQPPIDSKFEVTFAAVGAADQTWYNLSQVDGYTLPFKVTVFGSGANQGSCVPSDCSQLSLDRCPGNDNLSEGGAFPQLGNEDLRVRDGAGNVIGCMAPCKKLNYPAPWGAGLPESSDPALHMCCPTPIDPNSGNCTEANGCMTSQTCNNAADPRSVVHTGYVAAIRAMCPSVYSFAYDDAAGLHACPSDTSFEVTFCP